MKNNSYCFTSGTLTKKGAFSIYQNIKGAIVLSMGNSYTVLEHQQVQDLNICVYDLLDFDHDNYKEYYKLSQN